MMILAPVGETMELVDSDLFADVHEYLACRFRSHGLTGRDLDTAICRALPHALEYVLYGDRGTVH